MVLRVLTQNGKEVSHWVKIQITVTQACFSMSSALMSSIASTKIVEEDTGFAQSVEKDELLVKYFQDTWTGDLFENHPDCEGEQSMCG
jgi:hypothetical protein